MHSYHGFLARSFGFRWAAALVAILTALACASLTYSQAIHIPAQNNKVDATITEVEPFVDRFDFGGANSIVLDPDGFTVTNTGDLIINQGRDNGFFISHT